MEAILEKQKIIPVLTLNTIEEGMFIANLLSQYGFNVLEITMRTKSALEIAKALAVEFKHLLIGVGTVTTMQRMTQVMDENFAFAVSPGFDSSMVNMADIAKLPFLPGISTISEAMQALAMDIKLLKLFPAELSGGISFLRQLGTILPELYFCPTGGIGQDNIASYLALDNVMSVGLSDIAPQQLIQDRAQNALIERAVFYQQYNNRSSI